MWRPSGDEFAYRLTVAPRQPDFEVRITPDSPRVGQGGTCVVTASVVGRHGFAGDVTLTAVDLPLGFAASPAVIAGNQKSMLLTLSAPTDAPLGAVPLNIVGTAGLNGASVVHSAVGMETLSYVDQQTRQVPVREVVLGVTPAPPFRLSVSPATATLARNGQLDLKVVAERGPEVTGPVSLSLQGLPTGVTASPATISADKTETTFTLTTAANAAAGTWNLIIVRSLPVANESHTQPAPALALTIP